MLVAQLCLTFCDPWTVAHQAPLSMEFSRQEYDSELSFPSPSDLPNPRIELRSPALQEDSLTIWATRKAISSVQFSCSVIRLFVTSWTAALLASLSITNSWNLFKLMSIEMVYPESESESEVAQLCPTLCDPWTVAHQAPPSMGFSRQEYWSGVPFPSPYITRLSTK